MAEPKFFARMHAAATEAMAIERTPRPCSRCESHPSDGFALVSTPAGFALSALCTACLSFGRAAIEGRACWSEGRGGRPIYVHQDAHEEGRAVFLRALKLLQRAAELEDGQTHALVIACLASIGDTIGIADMARILEQLEREVETGHGAPSA